MLCLLKEILIINDTQTRQQPSSFTHGKTFKQERYRMGNIINYEQRLRLKIHQSAVIAETVCQVIKIVFFH